MPATLIVSANPERARFFMQAHGAATFEEIHDMACPPDERLLARCVAGYVKQAHEAEAFDRLILVAAPEFLGMLRQQLHPQLESAVDLEIDEDYTGCNAEQLCERIDAHRPRH
jgi:protein required for attachment to host cells